MNPTQGPEGSAANFELVFVYSAGRVSTTYYAELANGVLQVNTETANARTERAIPLAAIDHLSWGRRNLLYIHSKDDGQRLQTNLMGNHDELEKLVAELRAGNANLLVDENNKAHTESRRVKIIAVALALAFGLPLAAFVVARLLGFGDHSN